MKIVLFQPQIPQNTGNIARTCAATNTGLILVGPLGFSTSNRHLKRAGLDYWDGVHVEEIDTLDFLLEETDFCFFSSKATKAYTDNQYSTNSLLIFGSETEGLPSWVKERWPDRFFTIPMIEGHRCLNLASSAAIVLYEALRQNHFPFPNSKDNKNVTDKLIKADVTIGK
jgi:tRNA (cytidine/uridine-2'-O-)-methyltransferase